MACPDEVEAAGTQSLMDVTEEKRATQFSGASLNEMKKAVVSEILMLDFNTHPIEFTNPNREPAVAQTLLKHGIKDSPERAVLEEDLTPWILEEAGFG